MDKSEQLKKILDFFFLKTQDEKKAQDLYRYFIILEMKNEEIIEIYNYYNILPDKLFIIYKQCNEDIDLFRKNLNILLLKILTKKQVEENFNLEEPIQFYQEKDVLIKNPTNNKEEIRPNQKTQDNTKIYMEDLYRDFFDKEILSRKRMELIKIFLEKRPKLILIIANLIDEKGLEKVIEYINSIIKYDIKEDDFLRFFKTTCNEDTKLLSKNLDYITLGIYPEEMIIENLKLKTPVSFFEKYDEKLIEEIKEDELLFKAFKFSEQAKLIGKYLEQLTEETSLFNLKKKIIR